MPSFDPSMISAHAVWELVKDDGFTRVERTKIADGVYIHRSTSSVEPEMLEMNKAQRDAEEGKSWGDGKVVARIPEHMLYASDSEIMKKLKEGDRDHLKWWLNHEDNAMWRTKKGTI